MAKYCSKCGKALPDGVELCPDCHAEGSERDDAALFTRMTAETEVWKEAPQPSKSRKSIKKIYSMKERLLLYLAAVLLVVVTAFIIYYTLPASRVIRALDGGDYDKALSIYTEQLADDGGSGNSRVGRALVQQAEGICTDFEAGDISRKEAETLFAGLYAFNLNTGGLDEQHAVLEQLESLQSLMTQAKGLKNSGSYLEACDIYLSIDEGEADYEEAQELAQECLELYGEDCADSADELMAGHDYDGALELLTEAEATLDTYGAFSQTVEDKVKDCCSQYESFAMSEAQNLASLEKYSDAAELLRGCMDSLVGETEQLYTAYEEYLALAGDKTASDAVARAEEMYASGEYSEAFKELETAMLQVEDSAALSTELEAMESRFAEDMCAQADELAGNDRDKLNDAIELLRSALQIRELDGVSEHITELESYLPLDLVTAPFAEREGEVFRSTGDFAALDGTTYSDGWLWGADGASISYALEVAYDTLELSFAVRRDDGASVTGHFEVWCDGELKYTSDSLSHSDETQELSYDISGCEELKLVFVCDYNTVTGEGGYCYHGLCSPQALKAMPDAET